MHQIVNIGSFKECNGALGAIIQVLDTSMRKMSQFYRPSIVGLDHISKSTACFLSSIIYALVLSMA